MNLIPSSFQPRQIQIPKEEFCASFLGKCVRNAFSDSYELAN
jgi:hypothetical protein